MKKALSLFATLLTLTALGAQNTQLKKGTADHPVTNAKNNTIHQPFKPSPEVSRTVSQKKIIKAGAKKPLKKTKQ